MSKTITDHVKRVTVPLQRGCMHGYRVECDGDSLISWKTAIMIRKARGGKGVLTKCQTCYSKQAWSDYSSQLTQSVFCHALLVLHLQSLNPRAECWTVKEGFCFLSVKMNETRGNHMANLFCMFLQCVLVFLPSVMVREVSFQPNLSPPTRCANMPLRKQNHWNGKGEG